LVDSGVTPAAGHGFDTALAVRAPDFSALVRVVLAAGS
jgi:hypothetical protein